MKSIVKNLLLVFGKPSGTVPNCLFLNPPPLVLDNHDANFLKDWQKKAQTSVATKFDKIVRKSLGENVQLILKL